jgi:hypothetical protein
MRIEVVGAGKGKNNVGLGLLVLIGGLFAGAYVLGSPAYASAFPLPMERALTNLRSEIDKATEGLGYSILDIAGAVKRFASR